MNSPYISMMYHGTDTRISEAQTEFDKLSAKDADSGTLTIKEVMLFAQLSKELKVLRKIQDNINEMNRIS